MAQGRTDPAFALLIGFARAIPAIGLAVLFGWMAFFVRGNGGRDVDWFGPAFFALLAGLGAVWTIWRAWAKPRGPVRREQKPEAEEPEFDADAAIQRYLERRGGEPVVAEAGAEPVAPRPVFGRKLSS